MMQGVALNVAHDRAFFWGVLLRWVMAYFCAYNAVKKQGAWPLCRGKGQAYINFQLE